MKIFKDCTEDQITQAAQALIDGHLVAFPTETVYGLGADASNASAVSRVYEVKGRPKDHPLIVHISSVNQFSHWASEIPDYAFELAMRFWPGPMTLILPRTDLAKDFLTGNQNSVGLRIPSHPVAIELLRKFEELGGKGIAAPSANKFGAVSPTSANDVEDELGESLNEFDLIIDGGTCEIGIESTIIDCTRKDPVILRPGFLTELAITEEFKLRISLDNSTIKHSGNLQNHYSPKAKVAINKTPSPGDGLIALSHVLTPNNVTRLISPTNNNEFANQLYFAFRQGDRLGLSHISVLLPDNIDLGTAIIDRVLKAAAEKE
jgi:L-threonylcarbamoyladenylate synthase